MSKFINEETEGFLNQIAQTSQEAKVANLEQAVSEITDYLHQYDQYTESLSTSSIEFDSNISKQFQEFEDKFQATVSGYTDLRTRIIYLTQKVKRLTYIVLALGGVVICLTIKLLI